jgi:ATP-dependent Clp endopeptidase proteolytic subunit ClpP
MDAMAFTVRGEGTEALDIDIYDVIADSWMGGVSARSVRQAIKNSQAKTINVRINSKGGDVFEGFDIYNQLSQSTAQVEVFVGSLAASSASFIAMAGDRVTMAENAYLMIHDPAGGLIGSAQELRDWADVLDKIRDQIAGTYAARGTIDKSKALELMAAETWLTAKDAKGYGLADDILPLKKGGAKASARAFASLSFRKDEKLPDGLEQTIATARKSITVANLSTSPPLPSVEEVAPVALARVENDEPAAEDGAVPYKSYKLDKAGGWDGAAESVSGRQAMAAAMPRRWTGRNIVQPSAGTTRRMPRRSAPISCRITTCRAAHSSRSARA